MRWPPPADWPHRDMSRQVLCKPHRWHVQETGTGPTLILIHGAGGSTHSWRNLIPLLAKTCHVVALDLPGQGLTQLGARHRSGLNPTAHDMAALIRQEGWQPTAIIGHSAGGAVALRLSQLLQPVPQVIGINAALGRFEGVAGLLFPVMAKLLAMTPGVARFFARSAESPDRIRSLIDSTGSRLDADGISLYRRLVGDRDHVDATLLMMAQWSLDELLSDLPGLSAKVTLIAAEADRTVPPQVSETAAASLRDAHVVRLAGHGHLAQEEDADRIAAIIREAMRIPALQG